MTTQPTNQTVPEGQTATFTAAASGNPTPTVQWKRSNDGGATFDHRDATDTYSFTTGGGDNGAQLEAVFTNVVASVTTNGRRSRHCQGFYIRRHGAGRKGGSSTATSSRRPAPHPVPVEALQPDGHAAAACTSPSAEADRKPYAGDGPARTRLSPRRRPSSAKNPEGADRPGDAHHHAALRHAPTQRMLRTHSGRSSVAVCDAEPRHRGTMLSDIGTRRSTRAPYRSRTSIVRALRTPGLRTPVTTHVGTHTCVAVYTSGGWCANVPSSGVMTLSTGACSWRPREDDVTSPVRSSLPHSARRCDDAILGSGVLCDLFVIDGSASARHVAQPRVSGSSGRPVVPYVRPWLPDPGAGHTEEVDPKWTSSRSSPSRLRTACRTRLTATSVRACTAIRSGLQCTWRDRSTHTQGGSGTSAICRARWRPRLP